MNYFIIAVSLILFPQLTSAHPNYDSRACEIALDTWAMTYKMGKVAVTNIKPFINGREHYQGKALNYKYNIYNLKKVSPTFFTKEITHPLHKSFFQSENDFIFSQSSKKILSQLTLYLDSQLRPEESILSINTLSAQNTLKYENLDNFSHIQSMNLTNLYFFSTWKNGVCIPLGWIEKTSKNEDFMEIQHHRILPDHEQIKHNQYGRVNNIIALETCSCLDKKLTPESQSEFQTSYRVSQENLTLCDPKNVRLQSSFLSYLQLFNSEASEKMHLAFDSESAQIKSDYQAWLRYFYFQQVCKLPSIANLWQNKSIIQ